MQCKWPELKLLWKTSVHRWSLLFLKITYSKLFNYHGHRCEFMNALNAEASAKLTFQVKNFRCRCERKQSLSRVPLRLVHHEFLWLVPVLMVMEPLQERIKKNTKQWLMWKTLGTSCKGVSMYVLLRICPYLFLISRKILLSILIFPNLLSHNRFDGITSSLRATQVLIIAHMTVYTSKSRQVKYSSKHTLTNCLGWNLVVSCGFGLMNFSLSIFAWIFCRAFMLLSLKGTEWRNPSGNAIPSWLDGIGLGQVGIPPGGYTPPGWPGPDSAASAATKFWARRTWQKKDKQTNIINIVRKNTRTNRKQWYRSLKCSLMGIMMT